MKTNKKLKTFKDGEVLDTPFYTLTFHRNKKLGKHAEVSILDKTGIENKLCTGLTNL